MWIIWTESATQVYNLNASFSPPFCILYKFVKAELFSFMQLINLMLVVINIIKN